jgi:hypothetical protein
MILCLLLLITLLIIVFYPVSKFGDIAAKFTNYNPGCQLQDRQYPEGNLPAGTYLGLNNIEKEGLLIKFVNNDPNKLT